MLQQRCRCAPSLSTTSPPRSNEITAVVCDKQQQQHPIPELEESDDGEEDSSSTLLLEDFEESSVIEDDDDDSTCGSSSVMDLTELLDELMHLDDTPVVHFATPLISQVHIRPRTETVDKRSLYYSESEYRRFRREFAQEETEAEAGVVFHENVVTDVWEFEPPKDSSVLYYSEAELQSYVFVWGVALSVR